MKHKVELNQDDIRALIALHFDVNAAHVRIEFTPEQNDGPHHTPAGVLVTITSGQPIKVPAR